MTFDQAVLRYNELLALCPDIERKGKTMPYSSENGHMFTHVNKAGEIGARIGEKRVKEMAATGEAEQFRSHGANMRGYIKLSDEMLADDKVSVGLFEEARAFILTLKAK